MAQNAILIPPATEHTGVYSSQWERATKMDDFKKRKAEVMANDQFSSEEHLRSLLDPLSKAQLVDLLAKLGSQNHSIAEEIKNVASADPVHRKLFVRGLAWNTSSETLCAAFRVHGEIEEGSVIYDKVTGKSRGYGFITYKYMESTHSALRAPSKLIDGRMTVCNLACEGLSGTSTTTDLAQRKLFIGGLSPDITSEALLNYFGKYGEIEEGSVAYDKETNESRGFGFVTYKTVEAAKKAVDDPQKMFGGRNMIVKLADSHKSKMVQTQLSMASSMSAGYPQLGNAHAINPVGYTYPQTVSSYSASSFSHSSAVPSPYPTQAQHSYAPIDSKRDPIGLPLTAPNGMGGYLYYIGK